MYLNNPGLAIQIVYELCKEFGSESNFIFQVKRGTWGEYSVGNRVKLYHILIVTFCSVAGVSRFVGRGRFWRGLMSQGFDVIKSG